MLVSGLTLVLLSTAVLAARRRARRRPGELDELQAAEHSRPLGNVTVIGRRR
jgi:hypothetical protein